MTQIIHTGNSVAPLQNVSAFVGLIDRVQNRRFGLPGLGVFYGPSGYGKSIAATYGANLSRAYCVQVKSVWTQKKLVQAILMDLAIKPKSTVGDMVDQISEHLARYDRPLIIDDAQDLVRKKMIEVVRDIHESSGAPIILVGEEMLPQALQESERVHGRVIEWVAAQPGTVGDVKLLAPIYCPDVKVEQDLSELIHSVSGGSIRRVCVNLAKVHEHALREGHEVMTAAGWTPGSFMTGIAPAPRHVPQIPRRRSA